MSKICPNCQTEFDDSHGFCSNCGSRLVDNYGSVDPVLNLGDANAISGGVNINQSKNITSHDTHYHSTTVHERSKSESELKLDATNQLREKAEEIMAERGRIDSVAMSQLRPLATHLGIDDESFKTIIKDVRSNRNGSASGLSAANARYLQQAQQAVQTNDMDGLSNLTPRLEAMAAISQDDNVQYLYYLTLSLLYPIKSMEVYERQTDENYWRSFWAIISYIRTGKHAEATKVLALFDPMRFEKSEDDQNLLEAYFNIMKEDKDGAQEFLDEILGEPTEQVKPLLRAVESVLYEEEAESLEVRFYMERVMTKADVVVKSSKNIESPISEKEIPSQSSQSEKKSKLQVEPTPVSSPKENKEADELYAKACSASGPKRVMLLQKAADAGSLDAMCDLSDCYYDGEGIDKSIPLAVKWMSQAANMGSVKAQLQMGGVLFKGADGVNQNYVEAEKYLLMAAKSDNTDAQALLADLYFTMEEYDKSLIWARKAAQLDHFYACFILGRLYDEGLGIEENHIEGLKWFEKAANGGDADAQNLVGNIYLNADYIEHDAKKAFKYYQLSAAQGNLMGMCNLGWCYQEGIGTDMNFLSAEEWIRKAADGGLQDAIDILNNNPLYNSTPVAQKSEEDLLNEAQTAYDNEDYSLAVNIWKELAVQGNSEAMKNLGNCYSDGNGVKQDYEESANWYKKAVEQGNYKAMNNLGFCYYEGKGVKQDYAKAIDMFSKAADLGSSNSCFALGECYRLGVGVSQDHSKAIEWYQKAADLGIAAAMGNLGNYYSDGSAIKQNYKKAAEWYKKGVELGDVYSMSGLAWCYEFGNGVKQNYEEALALYQKSLDNGREKDEWISTRMEECKSNLKASTSNVKPEVKIVNVNYGAIKPSYSAAINVFYDIDIKKREGISLKIVTTLKPLLDGSIISKDQFFTFDQNGKCPEVWELDGIKNKYFSFLQSFFTNEFGIKNGGEYDYYGNLSVYDGNENLLSSYDFRMTLKYKNKIFGSDEIKIVSMQ